MTTSACVIWPLGKDADGYGFVKNGGSYIRAHRFIYALFVGPIPSGLHVLHSCDTRACVNPEHLRVGTHAENMADKSARGRTAKGTAMPHAKLNAQKVRQIRQSTSSLRVVAAELGIGKTVAYRVRNGLSWKHVP